MSTFDKEKVLRVVDVPINLVAPPRSACVVVPAESRQEGEVATYVVITHLRHTPDYATTHLFIRSEFGLDTVRDFVLANSEKFGDETVLVDTGVRHGRDEAMNAAMGDMLNRPDGPIYLNIGWCADFDITDYHECAPHFRPSTGRGDFADMPGVSRP